MTRRVSLTVLELGASAIAWASHYGQSADDCIVVAQQSDESGPKFTDRVRQRAGRLGREHTQIESVNVYAAPRSDECSSEARRYAIEELAKQMTAGGQLTLWSAPEDAQCEAKLTAMLAQLSPLLAKRQVMASHQTWKQEERFGVHHAVPTRALSTEPALVYGASATVTEFLPC